MNPWVLREFLAQDRAAGREARIRRAARRGRTVEEQERADEWGILLRLTFMARYRPEKREGGAPFYRASKGLA